MQIRIAKISPGFTETRLDYKQRNLKQNVAVVIVAMFVNLATDGTEY